MDRELKNKIVVVTGGAEGIGYAICESLLQENVKNIVMIDINAQKGRQSTEYLNLKYGNEKVAFIQCDVTKDLDAVASEIFAKFKKVDVLINNAGIVSEEDPRRLIDINVTSVIEWSLKFSEHMTENGGGTIINNASVLVVGVVPFLPIYQASKSGILAFTQALGHEDNFANSRVRMLAICPGFTETTLGQSLKNEGTVKSASVIGLLAFAEKSGWQEAGAVGRGTVEAFKIGDTGTAWIIENGQPILQHN